MREEDCKWDTDGMLIYKGVKLYITKESLNNFNSNELSDFIESQYLIALRYKRELILRKLDL
jgi:hypothetical protein